MLENRDEVIFKEDIAIQQLLDSNGVSWSALVMCPGAFEQEYPEEVLLEAEIRRKILRTKYH